jgi:hypothetical protein
VSVRDEVGAPYRSPVVQTAMNTVRNPNLTDNWIGANMLCRSSTMVRADAHRRVGLDDPDMVQAPDYELWTRGLQSGFHMEILPVELTFMRMHSRQVTGGNPLDTFLEMSFAALRNLVPRCERLALYSSYAAIITWVSENPARTELLPVQAYRLMGMFLEATPVSTYREFRTILESDDDGSYLTDLGRRGLALVSNDATPFYEMSKLRKDNRLIAEARDFWHEKSDRFAEARDFWHEKSDRFAEARDFWREKSDMWEERHAREVARAERLRKVKRLVLRGLPRREQQDRP